MCVELVSVGLHGPLPERVGSARSKLSHGADYGVLSLHVGVVMNCASRRFLPLSMRYMYRANLFTPLSQSTANSSSLTGFE